MSYKLHDDKIPETDEFQNVFLRQKYGGILIGKLFEGKKIIVFDESSFNTVDYSSKSWYFRGETLFKKKARLSYRVSLIAACDNDGGVYASFLQGNSSFISTTIYLV